MLENKPNGHFVQGGEAEGERKEGPGFSSQKISLFFCLLCCCGDDGGNIGRGVSDKKKGKKKEREKDNWVKADSDSCPHFFGASKVKSRKYCLTVPWRERWNYCRRQSTKKPQSPSFLPPPITYVSTHLPSFLQHSAQKRSRRVISLLLLLLLLLHSPFSPPFGSEWRRRFWVRGDEKEDEARIVNGEVQKEKLHTYLRVSYVRNKYSLYGLKPRLNLSRSHSLA